MFNLTVHRGGPLYKLGVMPLTAAGHAGVRHRGGTSGSRRALFGGPAPSNAHGDATMLAQNERFVHEIGELESRFRAARGWLHETFATAERTVGDTGEVDPMDVILTRQATVFRNPGGGRHPAPAYLLAGTDALRSGGLQRHSGTSTPAPSTSSPAPAPPWSWAEPSSTPLPTTPSTLLNPPNSTSIKGNTVKARRRLGPNR